MSTKMIFKCSCGAIFDINDATGMESHIDIHTEHFAIEAVAHISTTPTTLTTFQDSLVLQIRTKRDNDRLENQVLAEYPPASGKMWKCAIKSQSDWSSLVSLDTLGLVSYPFRAYTYDERDHYDITDSADLGGIVGSISAAVLTERSLAQSYSDAVLSATTEAAAQAAADPYLDL